MLKVNFIRCCEWIIDIQPPMLDKLAKHICAVFFQLRLRLAPSNASVGDENCIFFQSYGSNEYHLHYIIPYSPYPNNICKLFSTICSNMKRLIIFLSDY